MAHHNVNVYDSIFGICIVRYVLTKVYCGEMKELVSTNDLVTISFIEALLNDADIDYIILDQNMSILEGSIGIIPRRIMVVDTAWYKASQLLEAAGLKEEITSR